MTVSLYCGDCLEVMRTLEAGSVDCICTDLPYGTTACTWDTVIPFAPMWEQVKRVLKPRGAFVTTASQPFTSALVMSNPDWFKYAWVWDKSKVTRFLDCSWRPLNHTEDVCVFFDGKGTYNPQMTKGLLHKRGRRNHEPLTNSYSSYRNVISFGHEEYFPKQVISIPAIASGQDHPTQKPVALMSYLIRTYTNAGDMVLDFCMGSGTTGCAAIREGRNFVGVELDAGYFAIAQKRITEAQWQLPLLEVA